MGLMRASHPQIHTRTQGHTKTRFLSLDTCALMHPTYAELQVLPAAVHAHPGGLGQRRGTWNGLGLALVVARLRPSLRGCNTTMQLSTGVALQSRLTRAWPPTASPTHSMLPYVQFYTTAFFWYFMVTWVLMNVWAIYGVAAYYNKFGNNVGDASIGHGLSTGRANTACGRLDGTIDCTDTYTNTR